MISRGVFFNYALAGVNVSRLKVNTKFVYLTYGTYDAHFPLLTCI